MAVLGKVLITPKGSYVPGTSCVRLDCVYYNGSSWLALQPSTNVVPAEGQYWTLLAKGYENIAFTDLSGKPTTIAGYGIIDAMSTSKIANNVTTNVEGFALDARQGKALQDQITLQNDNFTSGLWTPTIVGNTTAGTQTYLTQVGSYTKINRLVFVRCRVKLASTSGAVGEIRIDGLPFAPSNNPVSRTAADLVYVSGLTGYTLSTLFGSYISGNSFWLSQDGVNVSALTSSTWIDFTAVYQTD